MSSPTRIVICGAGAIGAAIAYFASRRGARSSVIERHAVAGSASGKSGGFLALDWCGGSPLDGLARRSFELHAELSSELGTYRLRKKLLEQALSYYQGFLERRGVRVRLGAQVRRVEPRRLFVADEPMDAFTILWTAGVYPPSLVRDLPLRHTPDGRVVVDEGLRALDPGGRALSGA